MHAWRRTCAMWIVLAVFFTAIVSLSNVVFAYAENMISFEEKTPLEYTLEEYEMLTPQQQDEFFLWFDSIEAFEAWMAETVPPMPWELANRNPAEYTWDEYNELTNAQQESFISSFESVDAFENWMESVYVENAAAMPWENTDKKPAEYAWEEYENLTPTQQNAFVEWFDNEADFEAWMELAQEKNADAAALPWEESAQKPNDYTWAEYEALTIEQQNAFVEWFDDIYVFEAWMEKAQSKELEVPKGIIKPWEEGGKTPDEFTWAEFEALTVMQQDAFIEWFDSIDAFETWMQAVNPVANTELVIPWANDKTQPDAYTMDEFKELTAYQQSKFFTWFGTYEEFDSWLNAVAFEVAEVQMPVNDENKTEEPLDMTNAEESKDADEIKAYTWLEYDQMTPEQRILLFFEFDSVEGFDLWVEKSKPDHVIDTLMPWDNFKRQPAEYTWEEYEVMPVELQDAFFEWFESAELFEEWMKATAGRDVLIAYGIVDPNSDPSAEPLVDEQNGERMKDAYPCKGRTIKNRVNIRAEANTQSVIVGTVNEQGTEMTVVGIMMEGDSPWYLVNVGKIKGFIRGDLMEIVSVE